MGRLVRVLHVEDSEDDTVMLGRLIRRAGYETMIQRVETLASLHESLTTGAWDVVVVDYMLPGFNGPAALRMISERPGHPPVVLLSGAVCDEIMGMEALQSGARDYLAKSQLPQLIPAIGLAAGVLEPEEQPPAHLALCQVYMQPDQPNLPKAIYHGELALAGAEKHGLHETFAVASLCLGTCYVRMGWAGDAVKVLRRYLARDGRLPVLEGEVCFQLGLALCQLGDRTGADEALTRAQGLFRAAGMELQAEEAAEQLIDLHQPAPEGAPNAADVDDPFEGHLGRAEYFLLTGSPKLAAQEGMAALQHSGEDPARAFHCYLLLMRCARVQGQHKDAISFAVSARVSALEAQRHDLAFRATQAFGELYLSLGAEGDQLVRELAAEYQQNGLDLAQFVLVSGQLQVKEG